MLIEKGASPTGYLPVKEDREPREDCDHRPPEAQKEQHDDVQNQKRQANAPRGSDVWDVLTA